MAKKRKSKLNLDNLIEYPLLNPKGILSITEDQRPALQEWLEEKFKGLKEAASGGIDDKRLNTLKKEYRKRIPEILIDGKPQELLGIGSWAKGSKPAFPKVKASTRALKAQRENMLKTMTDTGGAAKKTGYGRGVRKVLGKFIPQLSQEDHHIFFRTLFEPFYEGLDEKQARELTQHFVREGMPLGNVTANLAGIDKDLHKELHDWAQSGSAKSLGNNIGIQVPAGGKDWRNIQYNSDGSIKRVMGVSDFVNQIKERAGAKGRGGGAKMVNFAGLSVNQRLPAINMYMDLVEDPLRNKTAEILHKQELRYAKKGEKVRSAAEIKQDYIDLAEDAKARQLLFDRGITPEMLDIEKGNALSILTRKAKSLKTGKMVKGLGKTEAGLRILAGDYVGGTVGLAMQSNAFQRRVLGELAKRGGKAAAKLAPGVGITMGTLEAAGYASQGRFTQSAIAAFGAAAGEVPGLGDLIQGGTDLLNTGIDIATGNFLPDANLDDEFLQNQRRLTRGLQLAY